MAKDLDDAKLLAEVFLRSVIKCPPEIIQPPYWVMTDCLSRKEALVLGINYWRHFQVLRNFADTMKRARKKVLGHTQREFITIDTEMKCYRVLAALLRQSGTDFMLNFFDEIFIFRAVYSGD
ncbi:hypothetical protein DPMN_156688 [Dreissena polymorpha]|uniref:Uncharacterized protein n=1 Tax=Dreissena polymorpha TaxID=45954 RepID=A0A9D4FQA3_DREPO|nr:hypothetical protein DPMN_156688 [Dreissena polymorpha]